MLTGPRSAPTTPLFVANHSTFCLCCQSSPCFSGSSLSFSGSHRFSKIQVFSFFSKKLLTGPHPRGIIRFVLNDTEHLPLARVVELVDSPASGAGARKGVRVRLPPRAPQALNCQVESLFFYFKQKTAPATMRRNS